MKLHYIGSIAGEFNKKSALINVEGNSFKELFEKIEKKVHEDKNSVFLEDTLKDKIKLMQKYYGKTSERLEDLQWMDAINEVTSTTNDEKTELGNYYFIVDGNKAYLRKLKDNGNWSCYVEGTDYSERIEVK